MTPPNPCLCSQRNKAMGVTKVYVHHKGVGDYVAVIIHSERCELEFSIY
jgi:hypothetical protein